MKRAFAALALLMLGGCATDGYYAGYSSYGYYDGYAPRYYYYDGWPYAYDNGWPGYSYYYPPGFLGGGIYYWDRGHRDRDRDHGRDRDRDRPVPPRAPMERMDPDNTLRPGAGRRVPGG